MTQGRGVTEKNEPPLGPRDGHVQASVIGQETHFAAVVGPDGRHDDDLFFSALVPVDALDFQARIRFSGFPSTRIVEQMDKFANLTVVGRNHPDVLGLKVAHRQQIVHDAEDLGRLVAVGTAFAFFIGFLNALNGNEGHRSVPIRPQKTCGRWALFGCASVLESVFVETGAWKFSQRGVHAVLRGEHHGFQTAGNQAIEEGTVEPARLGPFADDRGRKLLMVAHQDELSAPFHDGDQRTRFGGLGRFVHQNDGEFSPLQQPVPCADGGGANHLGLVENAGGHFVLQAANFFVIDVDVSMHHPLVLAFERRKFPFEFAKFVLQERQLLLFRVVFENGIEGGRTQGFPYLHRAANSERLDAQIEQAFEQVVDRHVRFSGGEDGSAPSGGEVVEKVGGRRCFPGSRGALNQGQTLVHGGVDGRSLRGVEIGQGRQRSPLLQLAANFGREAGAVVDVQDVAQQDLPKHRPAVAFG